MYKEKTMKTLVFFGSARPHGRTRELLEHFLSSLQGEVEIIDCYRQSITPCCACNRCVETGKCAVDDGMTPIYEKLEQSDHVLFAAPMYFHGVPGPMKTCIDRLQPYWAAFPRGECHLIRPKRGAMILTGGAPEFEGQFLPAETMLKAVLADVGASCDAVIKMSFTNKVSLPERPDLQRQLTDLAKLWNEQGENHA